jgi:hypothetical protein
MARQHENLCTVGSESLSPGQRRLKNTIFEETERGGASSAGIDSSIYLQIIAAECYRSSAFDRHSRTPFIDSPIKRITTYPRLRGKDRYQAERKARDTARDDGSILRY